MGQEKKFILQIGTYVKYFAGAYFGTIEEMRDVLNSFGIEVSDVIDIAPYEDLGVTYNRCMLTKIKAIGRDTKLQEEFLADFKKLVEKYSTGKENFKPECAYGTVESFFREREIESDAIQVLIADDITFRREYFDEKSNTTICNLSQRNFEPCSTLSEELIWDYLNEFGIYKNN